MFAGTVMFAFGDSRPPILTTGKQGHAAKAAGRFKGK